MKKILFLFSVFYFSNSFAFLVEEKIQDEEKEKMAVEIFKEIKCLVCQAQSIESSDTQFSYNLRKIIRKKILENKTKEEIKNELKSEFGDRIFMSIEDKFNILWFLPFIFAIFVAFLYFRKSFFYRKSNI